MCKRPVKQDVLTIVFINTTNDDTNLFKISNSLINNYE